MARIPRNTHGRRFHRPRRPVTVIKYHDHRSTGNKDGFDGNLMFIVLAAILVAIMFAAIAGVR